MSVRQGFQCRWVDNLGVEVVFVDVAAVLHLTLVADRGTHDLGESVDVVAFQSQTFLNLQAHLLGPWLGTKGTHAQFNLVFRDAHLIHGFSQIEGIRRGAGNTCHTEVAYKFQVFLRVTR